jgi:hypothetical protein
MGCIRLSVVVLSPLMPSLFGSSAFFDQLVGVAFADSSAHLLGVCEFTDSERFTAFESLVVQRGARECLLCADAGGQAADLQKLRDILEANGVPFVERKRGACACVRTRVHVASIVSVSPFLFIHYCLFPMVFDASTRSRLQHQGRRV